VKVAITGGTGFLGGHVLRIAAERGHEIRALARTRQLSHANVEWVRGALDDYGSLAELVEGCDAVIHMAGAINASALAGFVEANVTGTASMLTATEAAGIKRFVQVSSLSAREPDLSNYGWSKAAAEALVLQSPLDWTIVRPPAIFGAGDREILELFRMAKRKGFVPLPPRGRLSLIEAGDLAGLLIDLIDARQAIGQIYEPDDGTIDGYGHRDFVRMVGAAVGRPGVLTLAVPPLVLKLVGAAERLRYGDRAKLTADRVRYYCHPDWVCRKRPPDEVWLPKVKAGQGLAATGEWYAREGWL